MTDGGGAAELLAHLELFSELSPTERAELAAVAVPRSYGGGEIVFREGDEGTACHVIRAGSFKATKTHSDGRTIALTQLRPGDMFGELALFSGELRSATIEALEPSTTVALLADDVRRLLQSQPTIAVKMLAALANRVRGANERIARQSFQGVAGRVASVLLAHVEALQADGADGSDVEVTMTQADIAQLAGSARESASRFLAALERDDVVTLRRGRLTVHDPAALRNYIY